MEIHIDMAAVDEEAVDEAVMAMLNALKNVSASPDEAIVAMGEIFRLIVEEEDAETIH